MQLRASLDVQDGYVQRGTSSHAILKSSESQRDLFGLGELTRGERKTDGDEGRERAERETKKEREGQVKETSK